MGQAQSTTTPPHSLEAEKAVLGACLRSPEILNIVADKLLPSEFFLDAHQKIFQVMLDQYQKNEPSDVLLVAEILRRSGEESEYLGVPYLVELEEVAPISQNIEHYAKIIRECYYLRRIIHACQTTVAKALNFDGKISTFVEDVEKEFLKITNEQDTRGIVTAHEVVDSTIEEIESRLNLEGHLTGVPSEFIDLDQITGGWQKSDLIIVAARPGMGKTAFALNIVTNAAKNGRAVAVFTLEMSKNQLMTRILASESRIDSSKLRTGDLSDEELDRLMHGARLLSQLPATMGIDETPGISLMELRSRCRRFKREFGLDLVVVDYLQLMTASGNKRYESREREISEISGGLKALAKELSVPVIALAQLNRGPDTRPDKVPKLSDLRESGSMEQDADIILFLYRDEYYNPNSEDAGKALVRIAKNRHGSLEDIYLAFAPNFLKFTNLSHH
jgi:replicative DNA helicase